MTGQAASPGPAGQRLVTATPEGYAPSLNGARPARRRRPALPRLPRRALIPLALAVLLVLGAWWLYPRSTSGPLTASGTIEYDEETLAAESAGRIADLSVDEGSRVKAGQVVGHLVDPVLTVQNHQATSDPISQQLTQAQLSMLDLSVPETGIVQKQIAHTGEFVPTGAPILTVADPTNLKLTLYVLEGDLGRVALGQTVSIRADAFPDRTFTGLVTTISDHAEFTPRNVQTQKDRANLVFGVTVRVPNPDEALKAGLPVDATFSPGIRGHPFDVIARIWPIVVKEFIQIRRDPRTLAIVLALPVIQLLLFGYAINTTVDHIATVVLDQSQDAQSRGFLASFFNTGYFDRVDQVSSLAEVRQAIDAGTAHVGIILPPEFSHDLLAGRPAQAQLLVDGSDPNIAQTALLVGGTLAQLASTSTGSGATVDLRPVVLYNPAMQSINFMIPGLLGLIMQFQTLLLTAFAVVRERERGTLEQLVVTPIKAWELMLGKILPYVTIAFANILLASAIGRFWFGVEFAGSFALLLALAGLFVLSSLGLGLLISTVSQTQAQAMQLALFIMLPSIILSGFVFDRDNMPLPVRELGLLIPLTYFLQILRGIILKGVGVEVLWPQVLALAAFGGVVFGLSASRFRKTLD